MRLSKRDVLMVTGMAVLAVSAFVLIGLVITFFVSWLTTAFLP